jgi:hypothetical protein
MSVYYAGQNKKVGKIAINTLRKKNESVKSTGMSREKNYRTVKALFQKEVHPKKKIGLPMNTCKGIKTSVDSPKKYKTMRKRFGFLVNTVQISVTGVRKKLMRKDAHNKYQIMNNRKNFINRYTFENKYDRS